jgi:hypothetical protein
MSAYSFQKILLLFCDGNPKASDSCLCLKTLLRKPPVILKIVPKAVYEYTVEKFDQGKRMKAGTKI